MTIMSIKKIRIATSVFIAFILVAMGLIIMNSDNLDKGTQDLILIIGSILIILSLIIPMAYIVHLARGK